MPWKSSKGSVIIEHAVLRFLETATVAATALTWLPGVTAESGGADASASAALDIRSLRKEFGGLVAVNDIDFQVRAGEILGLIGPNGAGKSTTFNLVTGLLPATRGEVLLFTQLVAAPTPNFVGLANHADGALFTIDSTTGTLHRVADVAALEVIVHQSHGLHEGVGGGGTDEAEAAIDARGRVTRLTTASDAADEIGDLSRSFTTVLGRLARYNAYLEALAGRLSHELRTPVAVVRSSLENLHAARTKPGSPARSASFSSTSTKWFSSCSTFCAKPVVSCASCSISAP